MNDVKKIISGLQEAKFFFDNPEDAAKKTESVFMAPESWWQSEKVQSVRQEFLDYYAMLSYDWVTEWKKKLMVS